MICEKCNNINLYRTSKFCIKHYREDLAFRKLNPKSCVKCSSHLSLGKRSDYCNRCYHNKFVNDKQYYKLPKYKTKRKEYKDKNREILNKKQKEREEIDVNFKLARRLRHRLGSAIKGNYKTGSAVQDLGCTIKEFKKYLEDQFVEGMTWDNWAPKGWHIDHKKALANFDLTNREELLRAVHYTNLQPMWAGDNLSKGDKDG